MPDRHLWQRHTSKAVTFANAAGQGAQGTVTVFTITGRVWVHLISAHCTTDLTGTNAVVELGTAADADAFIAQTTATGIDAGEWWTGATAVAGVDGPLKPTDSSVPSQMDMLLAQNVIVTVTTADLTAGVIVFDVIYTPLTDGARLA